MNAPIKIRASSLGELFDCPKRWHAKHILKKRLPSSPAARLGHSIHAGTEAFDSARLAGTPISTDDAAQALIERLYGIDEEIDWEDIDPRSLESIALSLLTQYCQDIVPQMTYKAVELTCRDLHLTDLGLILTGTIDRVYENDSGELGIADLKTGATAVGADFTVKTGGHVAQMGMYTLLAERSLEQEVTAPAVIIGMQTGKTIKAPTVSVKRFKQTSRDRLITANEYAAIYKHCAPWLQVVMDLCYLTGQRIGDILKIERAHLTDEGVYFEQQKTRKRLIVGWTPELRAATERAKTITGKVAALTYLVGGRGGKIRRHTNVWRAFKDAAKEAGVENVTLHDLRAMSGTDAEIQGKDPTKLLGHTDQRTTRIYLRDKSTKVVSGPSKKAG